MDFHEHKLHLDNFLRLSFRFCGVWWSTDFSSIVDLVVPIEKHIGVLTDRFNLCVGAAFLGFFVEQPYFVLMCRFICQTLDLCVVFVQIFRRGHSIYNQYELYVESFSLC